MTKPNSYFLLIPLLLAFINGCDQSARLERKAPEDVSLAKSYFDLIRGGHSNQVKDLMVPALQNAESSANFEEMVATIPQEAPSSVKAIKVVLRCEEGKCEDAIILEYKYRTQLLLFNVMLLKDGRQVSILGIHVTVIPESFVKANEFTLANRGPFQYLILSLAILFPAFSLYALVLCIRARIGLRKWMWAAFILCGIARLGINWKTGQLDFQFLTIQILSAGAYAMPYEPWVISVSLPVGAFLFLINYRSLLFHAHPDGAYGRKTSG
jgi:hypothetical protein